MRLFNILEIKKKVLYIIYVLIIYMVPAGIGIASCCVPRVYISAANKNECISKIVTIINSHPDLKADFEKDEYQKLLDEGIIYLYLSEHDITVSLIVSQFSDKIFSLSFDEVCHLGGEQQRTSMELLYDEHPPTMIAIMHSLEDNFLQYIDGASAIMFWPLIYLHYAHSYIIEVIVLLLIILVVISAKDIKNKSLFIALLLLLVSMFFSICTKSEPYYLFKYATPMTTFVLSGIFDLLYLSNYGILWGLMAIYIVLIILNVRDGSIAWRVLLIMSSLGLLAFGAYFWMNPGYYHYLSGNGKTTPISHVDAGFYLLMASAAAALIGQILQLFRSHK